MLIILEMSNGNSLYEALDKNRVSCLFFKGLREINAFIVSKMFLKYDKIVFFDIEIDLID